MTLLAATAVFAFVFIVLVVGLTYFTQSAEQNRQVMRRMSRPMGDVEDVDITRKRKPTEHSIFSAFADFNLLRSLEEMMWQAGLYMRVSEMVLIIVLLFSAGALLGEPVLERHSCSRLRPALGSVSCRSCTSASAVRGGSGPSSPSCRLRWI